MYGLFLKVRDLGPAGVSKRRSDLRAALTLLGHLKVRQPPEALSALLERSQNTPRLALQGAAAKRLRTPEHQQAATAKPKEATTSSGRELKWKKQHQKWQEKKNLGPKDLAGGEAFRRAMGSALLEREVEALWLKLAWLKKKSGWDWRSGQIVATVGASINFMSVRRGIFPCATPGMRYVLLDCGVPKAVDGTTLMALQGVQHQEVCQFKLDQEKGSS